MAAKKRIQKKALTPNQAEQLTKQAASKRRVTIELTEEQLAGFAKQYRSLNPAEAMELIFTINNRPNSKLKVAGYSYTGDTCCA